MSFGVCFHINGFIQLHSYDQFVPGAFVIEHKIGSKRPFEIDAYFGLGFIDAFSGFDDEWGAVQSQHANEAAKYGKGHRCSFHIGQGSIHRV